MEDEFASVEQRSMFMKICLCYGDDAKRTFYQHNKIPQRESK